MVQHNSNRAQKSITETSVAIEPVAAVYNLESNEVESFVMDYLTNVSKVNGVAAVRIKVVRDGNQKPELAVYAFINMSSNDVFTSMRNVPAHLQRKMDVGGYRASDKLQKALLPIAHRDFKLHADTRSKLVYIKLDVFKVLGLMLASDPNQHYLTVTEVVRMKKGRSVTTVIKSNRFVDKEDNSFDRYTNIISRNED